MMKIKLPMIMCLTLWLSACNVGPDFKTPAPPIAQTYNSKDDSLPVQQHVMLGKQIEVEWWTLFACASLNDVIKQAIINNDEITAAKETLAKAEEAVVAETGGLFPQVALDVTAGRQKYGVALFGPIDVPIIPFTYYEIGPSLSWTPDIFGGTRRSIEQQKALADYQAYQLESAYVTLTSNVVVQSLTIAVAKAEIAAASQIIAEDEKTLRLVQKAFAAGATTKVDILNAQSQLVSDKTLLPPIMQQLSAARHMLSILLGKTPNNSTLPDFRLSDFTLPRELPVSLPSELVKQRPDILAAEANLHAASAAIGIATANLYPNITLTANILQEALTPHALFDASSNAFGIAGNLTQPIFNGGALTAQKREAEHTYQSALAQYQQTILHAFGQVADSLTALQHDSESVAAEQEATNTARAALILARKSYQAGNANVLQIQAAQRQLAQAQLNLIHAQSQHFIDTVQLFVALGGSPIQ